MKNPKVLVYKMTHEGDPNDENQIWGETNCMGHVRSYGFEIVIGIGGHGDLPKKQGIAGRVIWIGHKPKQIYSMWSHPVIHFETMNYFGSKGPLLSKIAPNLARVMLKARFKMSFSENASNEVLLILKQFGHT